jgi:enoyl-[acyl-carrier protein] reductase II
MNKNTLTNLFGIKYPIIQAGMIWCSGWELASAVSNAGGLGIIGAGSMYPEILKMHIEKCQKATQKPFGVNLPLLYPNIEEHINIILEMGVKIVFTSAGNPQLWTSKLKQAGITVVHVVSNTKFAKKAQEAGVDAVVAEGFEAGGHNGREETTTLCLIPMVRAAVTIPVIAAGGIASGYSMLAAMALGADGVQMGSKFVTALESSAHLNFKQRVLDSKEGDTVLTLKEITPVRLIKNEFYTEVQKAYERCASSEELKELLGRARAKKGMFEGDLKEGELEIGQVSAMLNEIKPAAELIQEIISEFNEAKKRCSEINF